MDVGDSVICLYINYCVERVEGIGGNKGGGMKSNGAQERRSQAAFLSFLLQQRQYKPLAV